MDVGIYDVDTNLLVLQLGSIADRYWVSGFRFSEDRGIQVFETLRAKAPAVFDRLQRMVEFSMAVQHSHSTMLAALVYLASHTGQVPGVVNLRFTIGATSIYLLRCGIRSCRLVDFKGVSTVFEYSVVGGTWATSI